MESKFLILFGGGGLGPAGPCYDELALIIKPPGDGGLPACAPRAAGSGGTGGSRLVLPVCAPGLCSVVLPACAPGLCPRLVPPTCWPPTYAMLSRAVAVALDDSCREQLLSILIRFESSCSRFEFESRALLSIRVRIESTCSRFQLESRALLLIPTGVESIALDSNWNREQCSRFQLESRALLSIRMGIESSALESNWNQKHLLSSRAGIISKE